MLAELGHQPLRILDEAVRGLAGATVDVPTGVLSDEIVAIRTTIDLLEAQSARRLRRFHQQHGAAAEGMASTVSWLRERCRLSNAAAASRLSIALRIAELPRVQASMEAGRTGYQNAAIIAASAEELGAHVLAQAQDTLVEAGEHLDPGRLRQVTRHLRHCIDPEGGLRAENEQHARRWLQLSQTLDGVFVLDGLLDAEGGMALKTALAGLASPFGLADTRPARVRRADALVELANRQLQAGGLRSVHGQRPHLVVSSGAETLQGGSSPGELRGVGAIAAATVRRFSCDAVVSRITLDAQGTPLFVDRASRVIPPAMRTALATRDGGCRFPGCDRPPEWTDAHHIVPVAAQGRTRLDNLVSLCRVHHRQVHEGGWQLRRQPDGSLQARAP